jgi:hypothetical protein
MAKDESSSSYKQTKTAYESSVETDDEVLLKPMLDLPTWSYVGPDPRKKPMFDPMQYPADLKSIDLGDYIRMNVTNVDNDPKGREYFDMGLRLMLSYQHELAARCFLASLEVSKYCALAHGFVALCHSPNYNFKGEAYYESAHHPNEAVMNDLLCVFPSQQVADRHSKMGVDLVEEIRKLNRKGSGGNSVNSNGPKKGKAKNNKKYRSSTSNGSKSSQIGFDENETIESTSDPGDPKPNLISDVEVQLLLAIRILACHPGLEQSLADDIVGRSFMYYSDSKGFILRSNQT